jgi:hypothetical protein
MAETEKEVEPKKKRGRKKVQSLYGDALLALLVDGEQINGHPVIRGLLRLAREFKKGIKAVHTVNAACPNDGNLGLAVVTKTITFGDGETWSASADAFKLNLSPKFVPFATATADTRALSRALRFGLGICKAAAEEMNPEDMKTKGGETVIEADAKEKVPENTPPTSAQIELINRVKGMRKVTDDQFVELLSKFDYKPKRVEEIKTEADATKMIKMLGTSAVHG